MYYELCLITILTVSFSMEHLTLTLDDLLPVEETKMESKDIRPVNQVRTCIRFLFTATTTI